MYIVYILEDNKGAIFLVKNSRVGARTKHIDIRHHFCRELHERKFLALFYERTDNMSADIFTKNVTESLQRIHGDRIRNRTPLTWTHYKDYVNLVETLTTFKREDVENRLTIAVDSLGLY